MGLRDTPRIFSASSGKPNAERLDGRQFIETGCLHRPQNRKIDGRHGGESPVRL